jgi:hypothetical protein
VLGGLPAREILDRSLLAEVVINVEEVTPDHGAGDGDAAGSGDVE